MKKAKKLLKMVHPLNNYIKKLRRYEIGKKFISKFNKRRKKRTK